jgi:hypothetical protein
MKKISYWYVFYKMSSDAKIFTLSQALDIPQAQAQEILDKITNEIKRQETLLALAHQKANISDKQAQEIEQLKKLRISKKTSKKKPIEGKQERLIRLRYYHEIERLRQEGFGWRAISDYIKQNHHKSISFTTLKRDFEKISQQLNNNS